MRSRRTLLAVPVATAVALAGACGGPGGRPGSGPADRPTAAEVKAGRTFTLAIGGTARVPEAGLTVTLRDVRNDGRCPSDVDCAWAGDATVVVAVTETGRSPATREHELHTVTRAPSADGDGPADGEERVRDDRLVRLGGHVLRLVGLGPARKSDAAVDRDAYRGRFVVESG
ncbi:hypothetical protein ACFY4C_27585 [Actinomadura viridis]|uniref:hypothetical protein n=1 Tax=Actinomadura viridis TaxID=58110 RepID=UPI0036CD43F3